MMESLNDESIIKITIVGDPMIGKTAFLMVYKNQKFDEDYLPTIFETYTEKILMNGKEYTLTLCDTAGQEDYERLRPIAYPGTTCFILCYAIDNKTSYENIKEKWYPELRHFSPTVPILLLGTKLDTRHSSGDICITKKQGEKMKRMIKADKFIECSARENENITLAIREAAKISTTEKVESKQKCCRVL